MTKARALLSAVLLSVLYWGVLLRLFGLDDNRSTLAALLTYPFGAAMLAAVAGTHRRVALRVSYFAACALPAVQLAFFGPALLYTDYMVGSGSDSDRAGAMAAAMLALALVQVATMAVCTWVFYRIITPSDRLSR